MYLSVIRGEWVDEWGIMLYQLWREATCPH